MTKEHPNISLLKRRDVRSLAAAEDAIAEDVVWHYVYPNLPDMQGDHVGLEGTRRFFDAVGQKSRGTFSVDPQLITAVGDELVEVHKKDMLTFEERSVAPACTRGRMAHHTEVRRRRCDTGKR